MKRISGHMISVGSLCGMAVIVTGITGCFPGDSAIVTPAPVADDTRVTALDVRCEVSEVPDHYQWYFGATVEDAQGWGDVLVVQLAIPDTNSVLLYDVEMDYAGNDGASQSTWSNDALLAFSDTIDCSECPTQSYRIRAQDEEAVRLGTYTERVFRGEDACSSYVQ